MALLPILSFPDPRLRTIAKPVEEVTDEIRQLAADMFETMYAEEGIGLAATQVDIHQRIIVIDVSENRDQRLVLINPELVWASDDKQALSLVRDVLAYFPANNRAEAPRVDAGSVADFDLNSVIPDTAAQAYDINDVIKAVVDEGSFFELSAEAAQNIVTGFAYIDGRTVGIVANQPLALAGALDSAAAEKAARFVRTCDAFNTPIVEFVDSPGFVPTPEEEKAGLLRRASKFAYAQAEASVGKSLSMKRFTPRARGRASRIVKPFSRIRVVVREVEEEA